MKKLGIKIVQIYCFVLTLSTYGQEVPVDFDMKWSEKTGASKSVRWDEIICQDETGLYMIEAKRVGAGLKKQKYFLEHYDKQLKLINSEEINFKGDGNKRIFEKAYQLGDKIYVFSSFFNEKHEKMYLFAQSINKNNLQYNSDLIKLVEIQFYGNGRNKQAGFNFDISMDQSKLLVFGKPSIKGSDKERFDIHVFDKDLHELCSKEAELPYRDDHFKVLNYEVNDLGQVFVVGDMVSESDEDDHKIIAYRFSKEDETYKEQILTLENADVKYVQMKINNDQDAVFGGYYSSIQSDTIIGCFYFTLDAKTADVKQSCQQKIPENFVSKYMTDSEEDKKIYETITSENPTLNHYVLSDMEVLDDGSVVLIGEQNYSYQVTSAGYSQESSVNPGIYTNKGGYSLTYYVYGDLMVVRMTSGKIQWVKNIPKKQISVEDYGYYSSYLPATWENNVILIFSDHSYNYRIPEDGTPYVFAIGGMSSGAYMVTIDEQGNTAKKEFFSRRNDKTISIPKRSTQLRDSDILLFCRKNKSNRFLKISFK